MEQRKINVNIVWVIACLTLIIVLLTAFILLDRVSCAERIVLYLSYTATLLSILLSIFAILFSFFSSNKLDKQIADINVAVEEIKATNKQLGQSNQTLVTTLISMHETLGHIEANQENRNSKLDPIPINDSLDSNIFDREKDKSKA